MAIFFTEEELGLTHGFRTRLKWRPRKKNGTSSGGVRRGVNGEREKKHGRGEEKKRERTELARKELVNSPGSGHRLRHAKSGRKRRESLTYIEGCKKKLQAPADRKLIFGSA